MSSSHRDWLLDLAKMELQDEDAEGVCQRKVSQHRRRRQGEWLEYQEVDISQNHIAWRGCKAIVDVCLQCQDLRVVKLFKNELTDRAAPSICRLLEECLELEQLHLSYNHLTGQGASEIIVAASRGRGAAAVGRPGERRERRDRGITLWLRLEHNRIRRATQMLEDLWERRVDFCEARDAQKCGPRVCKRCALIHLPYFSKQDAEPSPERAAAAVADTEASMEAVPLAPSLLGVAGSRSSGTGCPVVNAATAARLRVARRRAGGPIAVVSLEEEEDEEEDSLVVANATADATAIPVAAAPAVVDALDTDADASDVALAPTGTHGEPATLAPTEPWEALASAGLVSTVPALPVPAATAGEVPAPSETPFAAATVPPAASVPATPPVAAPVPAPVAPPLEAAQAAPLGLTTAEAPQEASTTVPPAAASAAVQPASTILPAMAQVAPVIEHMVPPATERAGPVDPEVVAVVPRQPTPSEATRSASALTAAACAAALAAAFAPDADFGGEELEVEETGEAGEAGDAAVVLQEEEEAASPGTPGAAEEASSLPAVPGDAAVVAATTATAATPGVAASAPIVAPSVVEDSAPAAMLDAAAPQGTAAPPEERPLTELQQPESCAAAPDAATVPTVAASPPVESPALLPPADPPDCAATAPPAQAAQLAPDQAAAAVPALDGVATLPQQSQAAPATAGALAPEERQDARVERERRRHEKKLKKEKDKGKKRKPSSGRSGSGARKKQKKHVKELVPVMAKANLPAVALPTPAAASPSAAAAVPVPVASVQAPAASAPTAQVVSVPPALVPPAPRAVPAAPVQVPPAAAAPVPAARVATAPASSAPTALATAAPATPAAAPAVSVTAPVATRAAPSPAVVAFKPVQVMRRKFADDAASKALEAKLAEATALRDGKDPKEALDGNEAEGKAAKDTDDSKEAKEGKPREAKDAKESKEGKEAKDAKESRETREAKLAKEAKEAKEVKDAKDAKDPKRAKRSKDPKEPKQPAKQAKVVSGLGDIAEMQKRLEDERNKLRLWVIKAKQEWEERQERLRASGGQEARGETDDQSYYVASVGELFGPGGEYRAEGSIGKGVFSSVYRCKNTKQNTDYAIKFVRSNHMMRRAAEKEVELYRRLARLAPKEDQEAAQYLMFLAPPETFVHQGHLCMVFDLERCDLRSALSKYGQGRGLPLQTVAQYGRQIFLGLRALRRLKVIHGDLKPDNLLMSQNKTEIKICDFGSAMDVADTVSTAYFQPRYYRSPEVMIGNPYDTQIDLWSAGVTLFELGTGRILFTGRSNNMMLRQVLEVSGPFPHKMALSGSHSSKHFNPLGDFLHKDPDSITGEPEVMPMKRFAKLLQPVSGMLERILKEPPPNADAATQQRLLPRLADLVSKCLRPDPAERFSPEHALVHTFFKKDR